MNDDSNLNKEIENLFIYTEILLLLLFLLNNKTIIYKTKKKIRTKTLFKRIKNENLFLRMKIFSMSVITKKKKIIFSLLFSYICRFFYIILLFVYLIQSKN